MVTKKFSQLNNIINVTTAEFIVSIAAISATIL